MPALVIRGYFLWRSESEVQTKVTPDKGTWDAGTLMDSSWSYIPGNSPWGQSTLEIHVWYIQIASMNEPQLAEIDGQRSWC